MTSRKLLFTSCVILLILSTTAVSTHAQRRRACCVDNQIYYRGGPVLTGVVNVYYIWYGTWNGSGAHGSNRVSDSVATQNLLTNLVSGLSGSPYENINTTYFAGTDDVSGFLSMAPTIIDSSYSHGVYLSEQDVHDIVAAHIGTDLARDPNGVYIVLTSSDIGATVTAAGQTLGTCGQTANGGSVTAMCGWHGSSNYFNLGGDDLKFGWVGNPDRCPSFCEAPANQINSPNNNTGGDGMANHVAHELEEAISDPDHTTWYDNHGLENADKCAWQFGSTMLLSNGAIANILLNGTYYLIQENWVNANGGSCAMNL